MYTCDSYIHYSKSLKTFYNNNLSAYKDNIVSNPANTFKQNFILTENGKNLKLQFDCSSIVFEFSIQASVVQLCNKATLFQLLIKTVESCTYLLLEVVLESHIYYFEYHYTAWPWFVPSFHSPYIEYTGLAIQNENRVLLYHCTLHIVGCPVNEKSNFRFWISSHITENKIFPTCNFTRSLSISTYFIILFSPRYTITLYF